MHGETNGVGTGPSPTVNGANGYGAGAAPVAGPAVDILGARVALPMIVAPMFLVSNPEMVIAACGEGVVGSFPAHSARSSEILAEWLLRIDTAQRRFADEGVRAAPYAVNLVVHRSNPRLQDSIDLCVKYRVPIVLSSKSAPDGVVERVHDYGGVVLHDIANRRHAEKALEAGVDGLIAVCGGAGGHTGTINPFALVNEVRQIHSGPLVLAGGMTTGRDVFAARAMGADLAYIGTRFIATRESAAPEGYKQLVLDSRADDVFLSDAIDGAPANWLTRSLLDAGLDLDALRTTPRGSVVAAGETAKRWKDIWTAGHGVGNIAEIPTAAELCRRLIAEYQHAQAEFGGPNLRMRGTPVTPADPNAASRLPISSDRRVQGGTMCDNLADHLGQPAGPTTEPLG